MRKLYKLYILLALTMTFQVVGYAQYMHISGKVINAESKERIPFANIALKEMYKGTASNALGEFSFRIDSLPFVLVVSHLSYEPLEIVVEDDTPLIIELLPGKLLMDELVIKGKGNHEYAYRLVMKAFYKISGQFRSNQYGKAFYRQISKNGDDYSELYEIFYDTQFSMNGVDDWAVQEGRYALKLSSIDSFIYNKNFTLMVRLLTIIQPKTDDLIMPVSAKVREEYHLRLDKIMAVNNRKVAQIFFEKKTGLTIPAMEGELWIDVDSYEVLKLIGSIENDNLNFISLKGRSASWKNYKVTCEIAFKKSEDEKLVMDYMLLGQNFDYYYDDTFVNKVETKSFLSYYEYYTPPKRKRLGGRLLRFNKRDSEILDNIGYNQLFWDENIIVKRTPVEAEVIASFEAERAFGSIYINNKNQIILEDYELDNDPFIVHVKQQLKHFDLPAEREKVYIHHDKPFYLSGDHLWFSAYLVNMATNIPTNKSDVLHVDLVSPEGSVLVSRSYYIENGVGHGHLEIPPDLESGVFILEAYTDWMKNFDHQQFFREELEIISAPNEQKVINKRLKDSVNTLNFYAEGESIVSGIPTQLGYVAKNKFGETIHIKGRLVNQEGRMVSNIKSEYGGLGSIFIMPNSDVIYRPMIMSDEFQQIDFPKPKNEGYSVMVNNLKLNSIDISVRGTMKLEGKKFYILVISNGILYDRRIGTITRGIFKAEIPKPNLPNGTAQILLVDDQGKLQCKRLVFLNQPEEATIKYYVAKKEINPRERVDLVLEINDENGKPLSYANVSVSVLDKDKISRNPHGRNIRSYFNLGYLADNDLISPGALFSDFDRETLKKLDWVMLSQQSVLPEIVSFDSLTREAKPSSKPHKGYALTGVAMEHHGNTPLANGFISLISLPDPKKGSWYIKTDGTGRFLLSGLYIPDQQRVLVKANNSMGEPVLVDLIFDVHKAVQASGTFETDQVELPNYGKKYLELTQSEKMELKGIEPVPPTTSAKPGFENNIRDNPLGQPANVILMDSKYHEYPNMLQVFSGRFSGLSVRKDGGEAKIRIRGEDHDPLIIVDGTILYDPPGMGTLASGHNKNTPDYFVFESGKITEILNKINPRNIERVELIKGAENRTSLKRGGGIISLYTKKGISQLLNSQPDNFTEIVLPGISPAKVFVSPNHVRGTEQESKPDLRSTLYWNPQVITNRRGRAKIGFYNSDDARKLQICVEGITQNGLPIFDVHEIGKKSNRGQGK